MVNYMQRLLPQPSTRVLILRFVLVNYSRSLWAWMVLLSAFACTAVVDGLILSFGLHVLEMMEAATWNTNGTDISLTIFLLPGAF